MVSFHIIGTDLIFSSPLQRGAGNDLAEEQVEKPVGLLHQFKRLCKRGESQDVFEAACRHPLAARHCGIVTFTQFPQQLLISPPAFMTKKNKSVCQILKYIVFGNAMGVIATHPKKLRSPISLSPAGENNQSHT